MGNKEMETGPTIIQIAKCLGYEVSSYSGRWMYGKTCVGITTDVGITGIISTIGHALFYEGHFNEYPENDRIATFLDIIDNIKSDHMGQAMIYYWPNISDDILEVDGDEDEHLIDEF